MGDAERGGAAGDAGGVASDLEQVWLVWANGMGESWDGYRSLYGVYATEDLAILECERMNTGRSDEPVWYDVDSEVVKR